MPVVNEAISSRECRHKKGNIIKYGCKLMGCRGVKANIYFIYYNFKSFIHTYLVLPSLK